VYLNNVSFLKKKSDIGIYVDPVKANPGAGRKLMRGLIEIAFEYAGVESLELEVLCKNRKAVKFYKKLGFIEKGKKIKVLTDKQEETEVIAMKMAKGMVRI